MKYNSVLDLSKPMLYLAPMCGVIMPNFVTRLYKPQLFLPIFKALGKLSCFQLLFFFFVAIYSMINAAEDTPFEEKVYFVIIGTNSGCCAIRIAAMLNNSNLVTGFLNQFNSNIQNKMRSSLRQRLIKNKMKLINTVSIGCIITQVVVSIILEFYSVSQFGREVNPNNLPGDPNDPVRVFFNVSMETIIGTTYVISMTAFEWVLLTYLRMTAIELVLIRQQLTAIFSTVAWNETHGICITSENIENNLDDVDISKKHSFNQDLDNQRLTRIYGQEGLERYKNVVKLSNKYLNDLIQHHARHVVQNQRAKGVFGTSIAMTYLYTVSLSISWIIASDTDEDTPDGNGFILPPFSISALTTLAYLSYFGEELKQAGETIPEDVMGLDWFLYPTVMKKKLVLILRMCQEPFVLNAWGQGTLGFESFKKCCETCYSLFTFIQGSST